MLDFPLAEEAWPHHWWFLIFPLAWVIVIALLIRFVFWRRGGCWGGPGRRGPGAPQAILAERYARGEIGDEEYRTRLDRLRADAQT
jgi:putative membrane protein